MKILKSISIVTLFLLVGFISSCTTKDEALDPALPLNQVTNPNPIPTPTPTQNGVFKVDFDGQTYTATSINASKQNLTANNGTTVVSYSISGNIFVGTTGRTINVQFFESPTNTYTTGNNVSGIPAGSGNIGYVSDVTIPVANTYSTLSLLNAPAFVTGSIAVASNNLTAQKIAGTFNCTVYKNSQTPPLVLLDSKVFTNGVFTNIYYTTN